MDEEALQAIAREAIKAGKNRARGLLEYHEETFKPDVCSSIRRFHFKVVITPDVVDGSGTAKVLRRKQPLKKAK